MTASVEIKVPEVGESITEGILLAWFKTDGDIVSKNDALFELETDKITMRVQAEQAGRLSINVPAGTKVNIGQIVGRLDESAQSPIQKTATDPATPTARANVPAPETSPVATTPTPTLVSVPTAHRSPPPNAPLAPSVRRIVAETGVDPKTIEGTGRGGRLTKEDVISHLSKPSANSGPREVRQAMTPLRKRIAARLIEAQNTAAILTTFNEVDMTQVMALRDRYKKQFEEKYKVRLGFMSFFIKATIDALRHIPKVNARIEGDEIVFQNYFDIGVAVGTEHGLVVPVIRDADQLNFAQIELKIGELAEKARDRRLELSDLTGGVFTISNGGVYGSLLSTPILNPPQSGILGMHGIKKRPIVIDDKIEVRPMMYLAMSYDHRLIDGTEAVTFLKRIVECIENPERIMLDV